MKMKMKKKDNIDNIDVYMTLKFPASFPLSVMFLHPVTKSLYFQG